MKPGACTLGYQGVAPMGLLVVSFSPEQGNAFVFFAGGPPF